jgi:hypothetical protein
VKKLAFLVAIGSLLLVSGTMAQMRPGAKVEKTYGLGLPRDMDKLIPPDSDYPVYPLKPGQQAYKDVDGYRIKDTIKKITAISLKSQDDGNQYWGRIAGTVYSHMTSEFIAGEYEKLGLQVKRIPYKHPRPIWFANHWDMSYTMGAKSAPLLTSFPIDETIGTPPEGITADAVWVGIGSNADLVGRDLRGKAVIVYSFFVPGGRSHSASDRSGIFDSDTLATKAGAAMIVNVMGIPGNGQFNPEGAPSGPDRVPTLTISQDEGFMLRDMIASGQKVQIHLKLDIEMKKDLDDEDVVATLPGMSPETDFVLAHSDSFFQGAMDNASGIATAIDIARHYAALPKSKRPRTMVFFSEPDHHAGEYGRTLFIRDYDWTKVALILNCEHTSQVQLFLMNQDLEIGNAINARRWYVSGSPALQQIVKNTLKDYNVSVYTTPEKQAGGSLGAFTKLAPAFHIIDHIIYHTTLDTPEMVPAVGLAYSERAFLSIFDQANKMTMAQLRGTTPLPNPLGGPPDGKSFGTPGTFGGGGGGGE